jgi:hypothetical protein
MRRVAVGACVAVLAVGADAAAGAAPDVPACAARHLAADFGMQGATGSIVGPLRVRNVGRRSCRIGGRPRVRILTRPRAILWIVPIAGAPHRPFGDERTVSVLAPGRRASAFLIWSNWCGAWPTGAARYRRLVLEATLGTGATLRLPFRTYGPRCDFPRRPSTLSVSPFTVRGR